MTLSEFHYAPVRAALHWAGVCSLWCAALVCTMPLHAQTSAPAAPAAAAAAAAAALPALPAFDIFEYVVDGNSVLGVEAIERAVSPFLGERKTLREVEAARAALERAYHEAGFLTVLVSIPEQKVDDGTVALHVVEATVDTLSVKGAEYTLPSGVRSRVPELAAGNVPNFTKLQTQLAAVNRGADAKATPILRAGKIPGTVEAQLDIEDQLPLHGNIELSNRQTPNTTAERLSASVRYDNLWQLGHSMGLTLQTAPSRTDDTQVFAANYVMPLNTAGESLSLFAVRSRSQYTILSGDLGVLSNANTMGVRYVLPLRLVDEMQTVSFGLDYKNVKSYTQLVGLSLPSTPMSYVPLVANYTGNWNSEQRSTLLDVKTTLGLRSVFGNTEAEFAANNSTANYQVMRLGVAHTETFSRWSLQGKFDFQLPSGSLVPTERFIAGGAESVRGYLEGERSGDGGLRVSLELRTPAYNFGSATSSYRLLGLTFVDAARLTTSQPQPQTEDTHQLRGMGVGLRLNAPRGFSFELDAARAMVDGDINYTRAGDKRVHMRLLWGI